MLKKFRYYFSIILLCVAFCTDFFALSVDAAPENVPKTVKVGYYQNEVFEDGAYEGAVKKGYAYEYYRKLAEYTGWNYEYVYGDFVTIYNMLLAGEVDLVAGLAYTHDRSSLIYYPARPMGFENYFLVKHDDDESITLDSRTLTGRTIGVLNSAIVDIIKGFLDDKKINAKIIAYNDYERLLSAFDRKEVDVIAAEADGIYDRHHAEVLYSFGENDYYLCVNKNRPDLLRKLNEAQNQLYADNPDYIGSLRNKYYSSTLTSRAFNKSEVEWLANNKRIIIGYLNDYLPYSDTDENGKPTGIIADIFPYLFKQLGINSLSFVYKSYNSYGEMISAIGNGEIDVAFPVGGGLFYSEEDGILITEPVISAVTDLVYNEKRPDDGSIEFAVNEKNKLQYYYIKNNYPNSTVKEYQTLTDCLKAVSDGEVSYTTLNGLRTSSVIKSFDNEDLSFIQLSYKDDSCFGVKIGNNGLLMLLNRGINVIGQDYAQNMVFRYNQSLNTITLKDIIKKYYWVIYILVFAIAFSIMLGLIRDIRLSKKRIAEKEKLQIELEKANHQKFVFVNKMANYMSDPLRGLSELIDVAKRTKDSDKIKDYLDGMDSYTNELGAVINNILNMSRLESGQIQIEDKIASPVFKGKRLLIVEDSIQNKMVTGKILKKFGFEIQCANDGEDAFEKLEAAPGGYFDAIIMDTEHCKKADFEAIDKIRHLYNDEKANIPIVAITSVNADENSETFGDIHTPFYFSKPYDIKEMVSVFARIFK
ncbi:transporter substrate-binding domain-containing protein [Butyrivibrio sp. MC2021]|uniref:transporter substrate-binding domain-containing protein n=1 Tax=Butyrivibrio sp. MC2021 TaxID=1408306 RepID=UPI00047B122F|nr:transporter substrate-binding domain-containing protein [Butyrivibrio sp. MC2021]